MFHSVATACAFPEQHMCGGAPLSDTTRWELPFLAPLAESLKIASFKLCLSVQKALQWADIQCVMAAV